MQLDRLQATLKHLHIEGANYKVLKLLPLVYVAWAEGKLTPERAERLVDLAHNHFAIGEGGERILRGWLTRRPDKAYFMEGLHDLVLLARAPDESEFDVEELSGLLAYSEAIARTTAKAMDVPTFRHGRRGTGPPGDCTRARRGRRRKLGATRARARTDRLNVVRQHSPGASSRAAGCDWR